jgi:hypothetical protein
MPQKCRKSHKTPQGVLTYFDITLKKTILALFKKEFLLL